MTLTTNAPVGYVVLAIDSEGDAAQIATPTGFKEAKRAAYRHARGQANRDVGDVPPAAPSALSWLREGPGKWSGEYEDHAYIIEALA